MPSIAEKFHPSWLSTLILGALIVAFLWLGNWQLDRAAEKAARQKSFTDAPQFETLPPAVAAVRYARVDIAGRFDPERHVLIDNQVFLARPGVHVLSPFYLPDGRTILVNRGWLPLAPDRRSLPDFSTDPATTTIPGILDELSLPGTRLGEPEAMSRETWPQLLTYPQVDAIAGALGLEVYPYVLLLGPAHAAGFADRDWKPVQTGATKHQARALQWFTFTAAALIIWVVLGLRRKPT